MTEECYPPKPDFSSIMAKANAVVIKAKQLAMNNRFLLIISFTIKVFYSVEYRNFWMYCPPE